MPPVKSVMAGPDAVPVEEERPGYIDMDTMHMPVEPDPGKNA
jgi:hypothetical protein